MTPENEKIIIERYESGIDVKGIASSCDVSLQTVYDILKRNNIPKRITSARERSAQLAHRRLEIVAVRAREAFHSPAPSRSSATAVMSWRVENGLLM